jgi:iron complex outermembrane recepter protein
VSTIIRSFFGMTCAFLHFFYPTRFIHFYSVSLILVLFSINSFAKADTDDFMSLSLEELLDVDVTSVSKKTEKRTQAAAAVYVISSEDIHRSTATNIPDLLRTVSGVNVAQIDAHSWSVTVRGAAGEFATNLLVLVDGRSVYTQFFSGVYWDSIDVLLEDIDRIEIIRGSGGAL